MVMHLVQKDNCCQGNHCSHGPARFDLDQSACRTRPYQPQATDLTQIKSWPDLLDYASFTTRETSMTTQGILILAGIVSVFAIFGITLAWADFYSRQRSKTPVTIAAPNLPNEKIHDERRAA